MDESRPVVAARATSRLEADLIAGLLRANGIRCAVVTDDAGGWEPQLQLTNGVAVLVAPADQARAQALLDEAGPGE